MDDSHTTGPLSSITYSIIVYRNRVMIVFILASLNELEIFSCYIGNEYLNFKCRRKIWTEAGTEFGNKKGMVMIIARALYGLKISGAAWREKLAETLNSPRYI